MLKAFGMMGKFQTPRNPSSAAFILRQCSENVNTKRPKAVIFDMGGVLLPSPLGMFREFEKSLGLSSGFLSSLIVKGGTAAAWSQLESGTLTLPEFKSKFEKELSQATGKQIDISPLIASMTQKNQPIFPVMLDAIRCIKAEGIKTAMLTNNWYKDEAKIQTILPEPLDSSLFDVIVQSCILGHRKPHENMYNQCVRELMVNHDEAVFLDDLGINLKAAKNLGLQTIKVSSAEQGVADLQKLLGIPLKGFVPGTTNIPKHLQLNMENLEQYLKSIGLSDTESPIVRVFEHGQSNPTYYVCYGGKRLVLRKKPPGKLLPSAHAVDREFKVMSAMKKAGVPVPNMVSFCSDESVIGTQFYLMDYLTGLIHKNPQLPTVPKSQRREVMFEMIRVLSKIHAADIDKIGLSDYGKKGNYIQRNFKRWSSQYELSKTHELPSMTKLMEWIPKNFPKNERVSVVHGDYRLDNLIYHPDKIEVIAAIDWELSTIGDPLSDLASCLAVYYMPKNAPINEGFAGADVKQFDLPTEEELLAEYCRCSNLPGIENFDFYLAFSFFRMAAILQGVYVRAISGQASSSSGEKVGKFANDIAEIGWKFASRSSSPKPTLNNTAGTDSIQKRQFSTLTSGRHQTIMTTLARPLSSESNTGSVGQMPVSVEGLSPRARDLYTRVKAFIQEHVVQLEALAAKHDASKDRWKVMPEVEQIKEKAKAAGLWNLFIPLESDKDMKHGAGLTNVEYAFMCEEMGKYVHAPEVFNCSAPDTGNMETLIRYGTEEQKEKWLKPMLDGKIRSCFGMTEPAVASSDATNIQASIRREGDYYIVNGHKWWTSGAMDPRCKVCIFMGKTSTEGSKHRQQSMILVPMDSPGVKIIRALTVFGYDDAPVGHAEVLFENVKVPVANILLGEGRGFEIAQGRLGPGRIHHCMRLIGHAERALNLMIDRSLNRIAFGKPLAAQNSIQQDVAKSRLEIEQARLLVLKAAYMMDLYGNKVAAPEIAMIKVALPNMASTVIDRAIQIHGGGGLSMDHPLATMFTWARILRLADGPDEVHMRGLARMVYAKAGNKAKI